MRITETNEQQDREVYVCATPYHLYIALLMIGSKNSKCRSVIVLNAYRQAVHPFFLEYADRLKKDEYHIVCRYRDRRKEILGLELSTNRKQYRKAEDMLGKNIENQFVLYNFAWNLQYMWSTANIFFKKCKEAIFVEESVQMTKNIPQPKWKTLIKKFNGTVVDYPNQEKLKAIFAQKPSDYPQALQEKIYPFSIEELLAKISEKDKYKIAHIFLDEQILDMFRSKSDIGIIYTQPLSEDGWTTEEQKISHYKSMVDFYSQYGHAFLKIHPRDLTEYKFEGDYTVLPASFPSEVFSLLNIYFKYAVSISSSAVLNTNADYKINLNDDFNVDHFFSLIAL